MLEKALSGSKLYWTWLIALLVVIAAGFGAYLVQYNKGLMITGMSRDVSWGFYIAQFTFLVGVAASAVMLVLPYYLHHYKDLRAHHHPGRVFGHLLGDHVHLVHHGGPW